MDKDTMGGFYVALGLALVAAAGLAVWLIGAARLALLATVLVVGVVAIGLIVASAFPIRAWKRRDITGEKHYFHDGTRTVVRETKILDGRQPATGAEVKLLQLPAQAQGGMFPELLRAAYQAGVLAPSAALRSSAQDAEVVEGELREIDPADPEGWGGGIVS